MHAAPCLCASPVLPASSTSFLLPHSVKSRNPFQPASLLRLTVYAPPHPRLASGFEHSFHVPCWHSALASRLLRTIPFSSWDCSPFSFSPTPPSLCLSPPLHVGLSILHLGMVRGGAHSNPPPTHTHSLSPPPPLSSLPPPLLPSLPLSPPPFSRPPLLPLPSSLPLSHLLLTMYSELQYGTSWLSPTAMRSCRKAPRSS